MWLASLLTSGAASFGRLLIVTLLPNAVPIVALWSLLRAHSFSGQSDWHLLVPADLKSDVLSILLAVLAVTLLAALLQPFQIRLVRLLEGYWESWALTARIAPVFVEHQRRKITSMRERAEDLRVLLEREPGRDLPLQELSRAQRQHLRRKAEHTRLRRRMTRYPREVSDTIPPGAKEPDKDIPLLPTALGNALRAGEHAGGERYGLDTITSWPRIYPLFSDKFAAVQASSRDSMDASATLCVGFIVATGLAGAALWDEPYAYWIPVATTALSWLSYVGAVAAAVQYGVLVRVAYDLHRFDLLDAMHLRRPRTPAEEYKRFRLLTEYFVADDQGLPAKGLAGRRLPGERYD